jgi:pyridoxal phosphate enzyme (YggS family)
MTPVSENIDRLSERIREVCVRVGREPEDVSVVAVTKTVPPERIREAVEAGIKLFGENRVQEAAPKIEAVMGDITWHMIGHLQRNKVKKAVSMFDMIQSVDSFELAREIDKHCGQIGKPMDVLVEVNTSAEGTKFGVTPEDTVGLIERMSHLKNIAVRGLMTVGAFTADEVVVRNCFRKLRQLAERTLETAVSGVDMRFLSMGMTSDFEIAIEEGSNMVRIGTAIFGARQARAAS